MYTKELQEAGLTEYEANTYVVLISSNGLPASTVLKKVNEELENFYQNKENKTKEFKKISRQNVYKVLDDLIALNLATKKNEEKGKTLFYALTPKNLSEKLKMDKMRIENSQFKLDKIIDDLDNVFSINSNKPGIQFSEGLENIDKIYDDMLKSNDTIYTYIDPQMDIEDKETKKHTQYYLKKREKLGIKKKIIIFNNKYNVKEWEGIYNTKWTEKRISKKQESERIPTIIHIYNGKIAYINFIDYDHITAFIIQDEYIYKVQRRIFEDQWSLLSY